MSFRSFFTLKNYEVNFEGFNQELFEPLELTPSKFINVCFNGDGTAEKHEFSNLNSLVGYLPETEPSYNFVEVKANGKLAFFRFIEINKIEHRLRYFQNFHSLPNKWSIFFNTFSNIVVRDRKTGNRNLYRNKYYNGIDYYVGVSSLIEVVKNSTGDSFEDLIPIINKKRELLKNSTSIVHTEDIIPFTSNQSEEKDYLKDLIGLDNVKKEISALQSLALIRIRKLSRNIPVSPITLHMVFTGNPGTGKTTVARLIGKIYHDLGLLKSGHLVEVTSGELEGKYVGHTAPQTREYFEKAIDGVLFIDEAYTLLKSGNNFGKEVIDTLLKLMEDYRERIVIIIAGYPSEMEKLLSSNVGFRDRFSTFIHFDDYTKSELKEIFFQMVIDMKHKLSNGASYKLDYLLDECFDKGYFKSNARTIRNIFELMQKRQSVRLSKIISPTDEELITFLDTDLPDTLC